MKSISSGDKQKRKPLIRMIKATLAATVISAFHRITIVYIEASSVFELA